MELKEKIKPTLRDKIKEYLSEFNIAKPFKTKLRYELTDIAHEHYEPFLAENEALKSRIAELEQAQRWISVEEMRPPKQDEYLAAIEYETGVLVESCYYAMGVWIHESPNPKRIKVTHWKPLPPKPNKI